MEIESNTPYYGLVRAKLKENPPLSISLGVPRTFWGIQAGKWGGEKQLLRKYFVLSRDGGFCTESIWKGGYVVLL